MKSNSISDFSWIKVDGLENIPSPALFFYHDRIVENIRKMVSIAGSAELLRPHVKTHKTEQIVKLQIEHGISKIKCSTIAEVEMAANCGVKDMLLAFQPVGPNMDRLIQLIEKYPNQSISAIVDSEIIIQELSVKAVKAKIEIPLWLDINVGMNRTGINPGNEAIELCKLISGSPNLIFKGLHVYDGHIHEKDYEKRKKICDEAFAPVEEMIDSLKQLKIGIFAVVAGGTPTFPIHAKRKGIETSPGTIFLWDYGYGNSFKDLDFLNAALVFTRVVSKPGNNLLCFDLGHKALCSDMPNPRVHLLGIDNYEITNHSEEHLVVKTSDAYKWKIGDYCFGIPYHICPTVIRYDSAYVVQNNKIIDEWKITARDRKLTI